MTAQNLFRENLGTRRYDLDWVRIGAFMLLILYHVGMYYVTWDWHVKSPHASHDIEPLMMLTSPWRLSLLFLVSGVATGYLLARQGAGHFLGQRSTRLLIPLAFGMLAIVPPQSYLEVVERAGYAGSFAEFWRLYITGFHGFCRGTDCLIMPTWNHLWFVAYLWVYTALLYAAVRLAPPVIPWLRRIAEKRLSGLGVLLWPIAYLVAIRLSLAPRFPATHALVGDWYNHAMYFGVFLLGFSLAGVRTAWGALERTRWLTLGLAVVGWAFLVAYFGAYSDDAAIPPMALRLFQRGVYGAEQWLAIAAVVGFAHRHLTHDSAARRYLTTAIFPVYILHQTVIVVVAHALKPSNLYPPVEGVVLVLVTVATCFLGYEAIRRVRLLRPLFGLERGSRSAVPERTARRAAPAVQRLGAELSVPQDIN
ncbi:MAG TPA: acyltransferase family protein [Steroidobacteraceae bacterium]|nr:acyltransferase family protein [Steroidobacteraceae bacterium]